MYHIINMGHDSYGTWLSHMEHDSYVTWLKNLTYESCPMSSIWDMTHTEHDLVICDMTHTWHDSCILSHIIHMGHDSYRTWLNDMWHDSCIIIWDMTEIYREHTSETGFSVHFSEHLTLRAGVLHVELWRVAHSDPISHTNESYRIWLSLSLPRNVCDMTPSYELGVLHTLILFHTYKWVVSPQTLSQSSASCMWHAPFVCDMFVCDQTVQHANAYEWVVSHLRLSESSASCMWHGPFVCDMTHYMWHTERITSLMICDMQRSHSLERI